MTNNNLEIDYKNGIIYKINKRNERRELGWRDKNGYRKLKYQGKLIRCHCYIYENYYNIKLKKHQHINHIDLNRSNNSISNLEIVTNQQNHQHRIKTQNNTTGFKNITHGQIKQKSGKIDYYYKVQIKFDGKYVCEKQFNKINPDA